MTYHFMNTSSKGQGIDNLEFSPDTKQMHYSLIVSFTKLDVIIKSLTGEKFNGVELHGEVTLFYHLKLV